MGNEFFITAGLRGGVICSLSLTTITNMIHSTSVINFCNISSINHFPEEVKSFDWNGNVFANSYCDSLEISSLGDAYDSSSWEKNERVFQSEKLISCARNGSSSSQIRGYLVTNIKISFES